MNALITDEFLDREGGRLLPLRPGVCSFGLSNTLLQRVSLCVGMNGPLFPKDPSNAELLIAAGHVPSRHRPLRRGRPAPALSSSTPGAKWRSL